MKIENNRRLESNEVIRALEVALNQTAKVTANRHYYNCPKCNTPQEKEHFNLHKITYDNLAFNCFICGFKGNLINLAQFLNVIPNNGNQEIKPYIQPISRKQPQEIKPIISYKKLTEILNLFFEHSKLTDKHLNQYIKKRDSLPDVDNTFSFNPTAYNLIKEKYGKKLTEEIFYYIDKDGYYLNDCILFTTRDIDNNIISYEAKRYKDKFQRPLRNLGLNNKLPVFLHKINDSIKKVIPCEGIEKAQTINEVFNYNGVLAVSIGGISRHDLILSNESIEILSKYNPEIIISFDAKNFDYKPPAGEKESTKGGEEKNAVTLSDKLTNKGLKPFISFLPRPTDTKIKEYDFDSYFYNKDSNFRIQAINELIRNKKTASDFKESLPQFFITEKAEPKKTENTKRKHKIRYEKIREDKREFKSLKEFRDSIENIFNDAIFLYRGKLTVLRSTTGGGKTFSLIKALKSYKLMILCHNKELVRELYQECLNAGITDIEVVHSQQDTYDNEIDKSELSDTEKEKLKDKLRILLSKGYSKRAKQIIEITLKKQIPYIRPSGNKSVITTHHKALFDPSIFHGSFDAVVIDEDITDKLKESKAITSAGLRHEISFYNQSNFKDLIEYLIEFLESKDVRINSIDFKIEFLEFLKSKDKDNLLNQRFDRIKPNQKKVEAEKDINELPHKTGDLLLKLIESIKNESTYLGTDNSNNFTKDKILTFKSLNKFETGHTTIILDATAKKSILESYGFKVAKFIDIAIERPNLEIVLFPEKTNKTSNILKSEKSLSIFQNEMLEMYQENNQSALFTTKKVSEKIKDIPTFYYGKHDKGINSITSNELTLTTPQVNEFESIATAKLLHGNKIKSIESDYVFERTGFIDPLIKQEITVESFHFIDPLLNEVYQDDLKKQMTQALGRVTRDYNKKVKVNIKSNVSLYDYDIRVNKVVLTDKSSLELRQDRTVQAEKELRQIVINSFNESSIIQTNNLKKYISKVVKYGKLPRFKPKKFTMFEGKLKVETLATSQLGKTCYIYTYLTEFTLLKNSTFNIDNTLHYIKENYSLCDSSIKTLKSKILLEFKLDGYYIGQSKQGHFYSNNSDIANQFKNAVKSYQNDVVLTDTVQVNTNNTFILADGLKALSNEISATQDNKNTFDVMAISAIPENIIDVEVKENAPAPTGEITFIKTKPLIDHDYNNYVANNLEYLENFVITYLKNRADLGITINQSAIDSIEKEYHYRLENNKIEDAYSSEYLLNAISEIMESRKYISIICTDDIDYKNSSIETNIFSDSINHILGTAKYFDNPDIKIKFIDSNKEFDNKIVEAKKEVAYRNENKVMLEAKTNSYIDTLATKKRLVTDELIESMKLFVKQSPDKEKYYIRNYLLNHLIYNRVEINNKIMKQFQKVA